VTLGQVLCVDEAHPWAMSVCACGCGTRQYPDGWYWTNGTDVRGPYDFKEEALHMFRYQDVTENGPRV